MNKDLILNYNPKTRLTIQVKCNPPMPIESDTEGDETIQSYNLYETKDASYNFDFEISCEPKIDDNLYDVVVNIDSTASLSKFDLKTSKKKNNYHCAYTFKRDEWRGDVVITADAVLKRGRNYIEDEPNKRGNMVGISEKYQIRFNEPKEKLGGKGSGIKPEWIEFKKAEGKAEWLNKFTDSIYQPDYSNSNCKKNLPRLYLNEGMSKDLYDVLKNEQKGDTKLLRYRDILDDKIASEVQIQMLSIAIGALAVASQKAIDWEEAWSEENLGIWQKEVLSFPFVLKLLNIDEHEYQQTLYDKVKDIDDGYVTEMTRKLPGLIQVAMKTVTSWKKARN